MKSKLNFSMLALVAAIASVGLVGCGGGGGGGGGTTASPGTGSGGGTEPDPGTGSGTGGSGTPTGTAALAWVAPTQNADGSPLSDLAGYRILYGTTPGDYTKTVTISSPYTT